jgi:hypothetical protein
MCIFIHFLSFSKHNEMNIGKPMMHQRVIHSYYNTFTGLLNFRLERNSTKNKYNNPNQTRGLNYLRFQALFFFLIVFDRLRCVFLRLCILGFRVPPTGAGFSAADVVAAGLRAGPEGGGLGNGAAA